MNVLFIWDGEYPWDIRVEKVCNVLLESGHEVHLVCRNQYRKKRYELYKGIHVHRVAALPSIFRCLNGAFTFPAFINPVWLHELKQVMRSWQCSLIIVRDLPMAPAAVFLKKTFHVPVILDMAECYPEMLRCAWQFESFRFSNVFLRNPLVADLVEGFVLKRVDHVFVMVEESRDRLVEKGVSKELISIVSNTPVVERFESNRSSAESRESEYELTYVGLLNPSRGVDTLLEAAALVSRDLKTFHIRVIGSGKHERALREKAARLNLGARVKFDGWLDNSKVPAAMASATVGIVPHYACSHWNNTIPNKLFDYMAAGRPVIVSDAVPAARIVSETGCGVVYSSRNVSELVRAIEKLRDPSIRKKMGAAGRAAVEDRYNWRFDGDLLKEVVNRFGLTLR